MKFSSKSEYGVRVMAELARHFGHGPVSLTEIAREEDLPLAYLEHIVAPLRKAGLVSSRYGVRGGYELARPPAEITMAEVVRVLEGPIAPMVCASEVPEERRTDYCTREAYCASRILWVRIRDSITSALSAMTVADLVPAGGPVAKAATYGDMIGLPVIPCADRQVATRVLSD
jgi:Rrf2 family protein